MAGRYDYEELRARALSGKQEDVDALGEWFSKYGDRYWNVEYYDADDGFRLYPIYEEVDEDEFELRGYELR